MRHDNPQIKLSGTTDTGFRRNITYLNGQTGGALFVADGRIYLAKGNDGGHNFYQAAIYPGSYNSGLMPGLANIYELAIPEESGNLVKADLYGLSAYALFDNGNLYTWGYNANGNLGVGDATDRSYPTLAATNVSDVYTHNSNTQGEGQYNRLLIKKTDGKIYATGYNGQYEMGLGNTTSRTSFTELTWAGTNPLSVWNLGTYQGMIVVQKSDGTIAVSGYNGTGTLGIGSTATQTTATTAASNAWLNSDTTYRIKNIVFGSRYYDGANWQGYYFISMLLDNGTQTRIASAGTNLWKSVGDNTTTQRTSPTVPIGTWTDVVQLEGVSGSPFSMYALKSDGTLWTWGYNGFGQQGNGNTTDVGTPAQRLTDVKRLWPYPANVYRQYYCPSVFVEKTDGSIWVAGYNGNGQCGIGSGTTNITTFTQVKLPNDFRMKLFTSYAVYNEGSIHIAVGEDNRIYAWGYNTYRGIDTTDASDVRQPVIVHPTTLIR